jgi:arsenate reductase (glutaredoxin)
MGRLYHNPRCSKSRAALELLRSHGQQAEIVPYLDSPPDRATLAWLAARIDGGARAMLRTGEAEYAELGLGDPGLGEEALVDAMARHPRLIERPIYVVGERAVIGRPPERVLDLPG